MNEGMTFPGDDPYGVFDMDEYDDVVNGDNTYSSIVKALNERVSVVIGWTDQEGSHLDILFSLFPFQQGLLQRGLRGRTDIFVSVMGLGAHGFEAGPSDTDAGYYSEKLHLGGRNATSEKLAELVNAIRSQL
jgi:hypothetical protein